MKLLVIIDSSKFEILVGTGENNIKWLSLVASMMYASMVYPHKLRAPISTSSAIGVLLKPRLRIRDHLADGEAVHIALEQGGLSRTVKADASSWISQAFWPSCHLCNLQIPWVIDKEVTDIIPRRVVGTLYVDVSVSALYKCSEPTVGLSVPLEPVDKGDGTYNWVASLKCPPGLFRFRFHSDDDEQGLCCTGLPSSTDVNGHCVNQLMVAVDMPVCSSVAITEPVDDHYSTEFLSEWSRVRLPDELLNDQLRIQKLMNRRFPDLCRLYSQILRFNIARTPQISLDDMAYLLGVSTREDWNRLVNIAGTAEVEGRLSRGAMMEVLIRWVSRTGGDDTAHMLERVLDSIISKDLMFAKRVVADSKDFRTILDNLKNVYSFLEDDDCTVSGAAIILLLEASPDTSPISAQPLTEYVPFLKFFEYVVTVSGTQSGFISTSLLSRFTTDSDLIYCDVPSCVPLRPCRRYVRPVDQGIRARDQVGVRLENCTDQ